MKPKRNFHNKVLEMTPEIRVFRKKVIGFLYEAREIIGPDNLPWIKVRIVKFDDQKINGLCYLERDYICIADKLMSRSDVDVLGTVWHELCHAYWSTDHVDKCPLMSPHAIPGRTKPQLIAALKKYAKLGGKARFSKEAQAERITKEVIELFSQKNKVSEHSSGHVLELKGTPWKSEFLDGDSLLDSRGLASFPRRTS